MISKKTAVATFRQPSSLTSSNRRKGVLRANCALKCPNSNTEEFELCRVFAVSDLHTNYGENFAWVNALDHSAYQRDILLLPGDVCEDLDRFRATMQPLAQKFAQVYYTFGNHETWLLSSDIRTHGLTDSVTKMVKLLEICAELGIRTVPSCVGGRLCIVPLFSWHHISWDTELDIANIPGASSLTVGDYAACHWPADILPPDTSQGSPHLAEWFDKLNDGEGFTAVLSERHSCDVISMSHFLPFQELLPEKRFLSWPNLSKAVGSVALSNRLESLHPDIHVFAHSHFAFDMQLGSTRFIQAPLATPAERKRRLKSIKFVGLEGGPEEAPWLPVCIYQTYLPVGSVDVPSKLNLTLQQAPSLNTLQVSAVDEEQVLQTPLPNGQSRYEWPVRGTEKKLLHGSGAPDLPAMWSSYYKHAPRTPWVTTLAPWVAKRWEKRQSRFMNGESSSDND